MWCELQWANFKLKGLSLASWHVIFNGCGMHGSTACSCFPLFLLVVTCKIGSFSCSLDNLLQKMLFVCLFACLFVCLVLKIKFQNEAHLKKGLFLTYFSHFLIQGKVTKIPSAHISLTYIHTYIHTYTHTYIHTYIHKYIHTYMYFAHLIDFFCLTSFEKNTNLSGMVSLWYDSWCWFLFAPFWNNW